MLIWSGRGILTPLILAAAVLLYVFLSSAEVVRFTFPLAFLLAGAANWYLGKRWNGKPGRIMMDESTGERIEYKPNHTLFWIKMEYWGVVFGIIGLVQLITAFI